MIRVMRRVIDNQQVTSWAAQLAFSFNAPKSKQSGIPTTSFPFRLRDEFNCTIRETFTTFGYWLEDYASVRLQLPGDQPRALPWHQDSAVVLGKRFGYLQGVVVWLPLTPITPSCPGLEIARCPIPMLHYGDKSTGYLRMYHPPFGKREIISDLAPGDALIFNINYPHRTYLRPWMTLPRMSIDLRFVKEVPQSYKDKV